MREPLRARQCRFVRPIQRSSRPCQGFLERIEIHYNQVDFRMPCSAMTSPSISRRPSRPPWMRGCSVLTRPPMISGNSVTSLTRVTDSPALQWFWHSPRLIRSECLLRSTHELNRSIRFVRNADKCAFGKDSLGHAPHNRPCLASFVLNAA